MLYLLMHICNKCSDRVLRLSPGMTQISDGRPTRCYQRDYILLLLFIYSFIYLERKRGTEREKETEKETNEEINKE